MDYLLGGVPPLFDYAHELVRHPPTLAGVQNVVGTAQPATVSSRVQTSPPWIAPIGLYADSSGWQVNTTVPGVLYRSFFRTGK